MTRAVGACGNECPFSGGLGVSPNFNARAASATKELAQEGQEWQ
jgi:hypothetical protein